MRKSLLLLALSGGTLLAAQAQTTIGPGTGLLSGSVGYHSTTDNVSSTSGNGNASSSSVRYSTFGLDIAAGGFVANNLAIGLQLNHTVTGGSASSSSNIPQSGPSTSSTLRVGPFVQYYRMLGEQFGFTATLGAGYESDLASRQTLQYYNSYPIYYYYNQKVSGYYAALTPGIVFFPIPKFALTANIGSLAFTHLKAKNDSPAGSTVPEETINSFDAGFGFSQLQFGASYYFGRK